MKLYQLSIFLENKPGRLHQCYQILAQNHIPVTAASLADTQNYGILRLIVRDWQEAQEILSKSGFTVSVVDLVALEIDNSVSAMADIFQILDELKINVDYMLTVAVIPNKKTVLALRVDRPEWVIQSLQSRGIYTDGDINTIQAPKELQV
jgi:hypothetical protein